jgi:hypothetical protein
MKGLRVRPGPFLFQASHYQKYTIAHGGKLLLMAPKDSRGLSAIPVVTKLPPRADISLRKDYVIYG